MVQNLAAYPGKGEHEITGYGRRAKRFRSVLSLSNGYRGRRRFWNVLPANVQT